LQVFTTNIDAASGEFKEREQAYRKIAGELRERLSLVSSGGGEKAVQKHRERGKLLPRERIGLLTDPDSPFLELSPLAAWEMYEHTFPSAGIVTGIGMIHGKHAVIIANDATVKGGTYVRETLRKHIRAQEIAMQYGLPCVYLVDSGGIFLPVQAEVFPDRFDFGRIFYNQARMSAQGIPQISVVLGFSTAGGAYVPAMSDETIIVRGQGAIFIGGPPLVRAATGEEVTPEELGGAEIHTEISGVAYHLAENEQHAFSICRDIFETLPQRQEEFPEITESEDPVYPAEQLYGLAPLDLSKPSDAREIIARIVDGSKFQEFKERYGTTLVTGFTRIMGIPVGIIANNGVLFSESALKGTHFIELCNFRRIPILFLQNITGFMVGKQYEHQGIARDGAKMVHAVANASVLKITLITGGSFGAGNYAMAGRAFDPGFLFTWPASRISVMGGEQASGVLTQVKKDQLKRSGRNWNTETEQKIRKKILKDYDKESSAYYATARLWDDGIIDPADTRKVLGLTLSLSFYRKFPDPESGIYRM